MRSCFTTGAVASRPIAANGAELSQAKARLATGIPLPPDDGAGLLVQQGVYPILTSARTTCGSRRQRRHNERYGWRSSVICGPNQSWTGLWLRGNSPCQNVPEPNRLAALGRINYRVDVWSTAAKSPRPKTPRCFGVRLTSAACPPGATNSLPSASIRSTPATRLRTVDD